MSLCSLAEVKAQLNKSGSVVTDDAELQDYIDAVTAPVEDFCGPILPQTITEWHTPNAAFLQLDSAPMTAITSLTEFLGTTSYTYTQVSTPSTASQFTYMLLDPNLATLMRVCPGGPTPFIGMIQVVVQAGLASVPKSIDLAARLIVQSLWRTQNGGAGLPSLTDEPTAQFPGFESPIPARAAMLLERYRRTPRLY